MVHRVVLPPRSSLTGCGHVAFLGAPAPGRCHRHERLVAGPRRPPHERPSGPARTVLQLRHERTPRPPTPRTKESTGRLVPRRTDPARMRARAPPDAQSPKPGSIGFHQRLSESPSRSGIPTALKKPVGCSNQSHLSRRFYGRGNRALVNHGNAENLWFVSLGEWCSGEPPRDTRAGDG